MPLFNDTPLNKSNDKPELKVTEKSKVNSPNVSQNKMVRTDSTEQKIDKFLSTSNSSLLMLPRSKSNDVIKK